MLPGFPQTSHIPAASVVTLSALSECRHPSLALPKFLSHTGDDRAVTHEQFLRRQAERRTQYPGPPAVAHVFQLVGLSVVMKPGGGQPESAGHFGEQRVNARGVPGRRAKQNAVV